MAETNDDNKVQAESKQCRVCLENQGTVPLFGDENHPDISIEFTIFGRVEVHHDDKFPKLLCKECFSLLDGAVSFRKAAIRSDIILKERKKELNGNNLSMNVKAEVEIYPLKNYEKWPCIFIDQDFIKRNKTANENSPLEVKKEVLDNVEFDDENEFETPIAKNKIKEEYLKCYTCSMNFPSTDDLDLHEITCTEKQNYSFRYTLVDEKKMKSENCRKPQVKDKKCQLCKKYYSEENYATHMRDEHQIKKRSRVKDKKCELCNMNLTHNMYPKHMLKVHKIRPTIPKTKECPICKRMCRPDYLKIHMKIIHEGGYLRKPKQKVECPVCKKVFAQRYYKVHIKSHDQGKRDYVCDICGRDFIFRCAFMKHKATHTNELPFKCDHCPYRGRNKELLRIHTRSHTGDYPYKCDHCSVRCVTKSNLNRHMRQHTNAVKHLCDTCNRGFYTKVELERHISAIHLGIKNHLCNICGAAFGYKRVLMGHMRKVHKIIKERQNALYLKLQSDAVHQEST